MSIADQITRLNNAKAAIKSSIENKGVTVSDTALLDEYPALIDSIEVGSGGEGGGNPAYEVYFNLKTKDNTYYYELFKEYKGTELDVSNLDTSNVTTMNRMFHDCNNLTSLDVNKWDTSNVTNMGSMFYSCSSLTQLDLSNFDTTNVTDMQSMFYSCYKLTSLDVSNWDVSNVTNMYCMLSDCRSLTSLDISNFNTSNVTRMDYLFNECKNLTSLDVSNFDTINVINMQNMFYNCMNLTSLDLSNFNTTNVTNTKNMFRYCDKLHTIHLDNCSYDTISKLITSSNFPTNAIDGVTRTIYCKEENAAGLTPPTNWVFNFIVDEPEEPDTGDIPLYEVGQFRGNSELTEVRTMVTSEHTDLSYMFESCTNLISVNTQDWDVSNVTTMAGMFSQTYGMPLTSLDFSNWDTSNVTNFSNMFSYMQSGYLRKIDLSSFNTSNATEPYSMSGIFNWCYNLQELDIRNFTVSSGDCIVGMFEGCDSLYILRLDNCDNNTISNIVNYSSMPTGQANIYNPDTWSSDYVIRKIYCKEIEGLGVTLPDGWEFVFVD